MSKNKYEAQIHAKLNVYDIVGEMIQSRTLKVGNSISWLLHKRLETLICMNFFLIQKHLFYLYYHACHFSIYGEEFFNESTKRIKIHFNISFIKKLRHRSNLKKPSTPTFHILSTYLSIQKYELSENYHVALCNSQLCT